MSENIDLRGKVRDLTEPSAEKAQFLLDLMPQAVVAPMGAAVISQDEVLISCRPYPNSQKKVEDLTPLQYAILVLKGHSFSAAAIGGHLDVKETKVNQQASDAYAKLGAPNEDIASTFVPIREVDLQHVPSTRIKRGYPSPVLTALQQDLLEYIKMHKTNGQIADLLGLSPNTIRSQKGIMFTALGLKNAVELQRYAGAQKNLNKYAGTVKSAVLSTMPSLVKLIRSVEEHATEYGIDPTAAPMHTVKNPDLLATLAELGFVTGEEAKTGELGLYGLMAALLHKRRNPRSAMQDPLKARIVKELIKTEVDRNLRGRDC